MITVLNREGGDALVIITLQVGGWGGVLPKSGYAFMDHP